MTKYKTIQEFLNDLDSNKKAQVELLRSIIQNAENSLEETIKWNAPSYIYNGIHRITFNLLNKENLVKLVLHMDTAKKEDKKAKPIMEDSSGLITWNSDIRGMLTFESLEDIEAKNEILTEIIREWLKLNN